MVAERIFINKTALDRLQAACNALEKYVSNIRYQEWPTIGLGIGLEPHDMDELIIEAQAAMTNAKRQTRKGV